MFYKDKQSVMISDDMAATRKIVATRIIRPKTQ